MTLQVTKCQHAVDLTRETCALCSATTWPNGWQPAYEWVTAFTTQSVNNQNGGHYYAPLFDGWTKDGWEIVSITPIPHASSWMGFVLVGVLRRAKPLPPAARPTADAGGGDVTRFQLEQPSRQPAIQSHIAQLVRSRINGRPSR